MEGVTVIHHSHGLLVCEHPLVAGLTALPVVLRHPSDLPTQRTSASVDWASSGVAASLHPQHTELTAQEYAASQVQLREGSEKKRKKLLEKNSIWGGVNLEGHFPVKYEFFFLASKWPNSSRNAKKIFHFCGPPT